ncbi:MAG TPA: hypothetical protein VNN22_06015 [Verrucomicrobiae bacterium]|nr:hypothetical protein [Verrucomicrobiae bacterium]
MKILNSFLALAAVAFLAAGCGNSSTPQPATNPADVDNPLVNAKRTADKAIDTAALNQEIQLFNVQEGRLPKTLQELVPKYVGKIPDAPLGYKISYDAVKGEVSVVRE